MKAHAARFVLRAGVLFAPLALVACGGGGDGPQACSNPNPAVCAAVGSAQTSASATDNFTTTNPNAGTLFSTAPNAVTLNAGSSAIYTVGGGTPPYTTTSGNTNVGRASISGTTLSLSGVAAGTSPIVVVDSVGKAVNIALTVLAQGQQGTALSITPGTITTGDCTTNIPFFFSGGVAPYRIFTSDNIHLPVSSAQSSAGRSYFTTSVQYNGALVATMPHTETVTILDSQSRTATANIVVTTSQTCATNPLFVATPETLSIRVSEILAIQLAGGSPSTTAHTFRFTDNENGTSTATSSVVQIVPGTDAAKTFSIRALAAGKTMITVGDPIDGQNVNISVSVF